MVSRDRMTVGNVNVTMTGIADMKEQTSVEDSH